ncbi:hypothetical protein [Pseudomonas sp. GL-B-19]|uniref:hypothetical protein n=1 Tax=Pseudomonas sp. GL-B-19 TaxID=2832393 RepID=UPI001CBFAEB0|nr:hypothetical protein [Pseudomonas sp. GL-B-19]
MKETKPALFSPIQITMSTNENIGSTTVDKAIARNHDMLLDSFFHPLLGLEEYKKLLEDIRAITDNPALQAELEIRWMDEDSQQSEKIKTLLQDARYACLYLELARAAETHNDRDRAWAFTCYASVMVGEVTEKSAAVINKMNRDARSIQNSKNAQGRNKATLQVKEEVARLLEEKRPEAGWPSKEKVVTGLETPLTGFIEKNNILGIRISNIDTWLKEWLRGDELVNPAWEKNKHANA